MSAMFSQTCEYAIRAMIEIAKRPRDEFVLARDLSEKLQIPHQYLSKILQQLVRVRVLESTRGRLGGFKLTRKPSELLLLEIVSPFEDIQKTEECILGEAKCSDATACPLHEFWKSVRGQYQQELTTRTLEDFAKFERKPQRKSARQKAA
ncbi:Putative HTH-type transcriptional regulator [uncultured bacterium]|nr:Putative HTH-type transcriptional regulator [uncultured bacterium]